MKCKFDLKGKIALVTGGSNGIGLATSQMLVEEEAVLNIVDLQKKDFVEELCKKTGGQLYQADVGDYKRAHEIVRDIFERFSTLDILINNAGISKDAILWKLEEDQWNDVLRVDLKGVFNYISAYSREVRQAKNFLGGKIVNVSSTTALRARHGLANYSAAKAGIIGLSRACARDLGKFNINCNAVAPGLTETDLTKKIPQDVKDRLIQESCIGRLAKPEDIAAVILFLCSDAARHITGEVIRIDGGQLA